MQIVWIYCKREDDRVSGQTARRLNPGGVRWGASDEDEQGEEYHIFRRGDSMRLMVIFDFRGSGYIQHVSIC